MIYVMLVFGREEGREEGREHDNGDYICWEFDSSLSFCHLSRRMRNGDGPLAPCFVCREGTPIPNTLAVRFF